MFVASDLSDTVRLLLLLFDVASAQQLQQLSYYYSLILILTQLLISRHKQFQTQTLVITSRSQR